MNEFMAQAKGPDFTKSLTYLTNFQASIKRMLWKLKSLVAKNVILTFPVQITDEEEKVKCLFLHLFVAGTSKGFMKALKAFVNLLRHHKER